MPSICECDQCDHHFVHLTVQPDDRQDNIYIFILLTVWQERAIDDHQVGLMRSSVVILIFLQLVSDVTTVCCCLCWEDFTCDIFIIDNITSWSANQWPRHIAGIKSCGGGGVLNQHTPSFLWTYQSLWTHCLRLSASLSLFLSATLSLHLLQTLEGWVSEGWATECDEEMN